MGLGKYLKLTRAHTAPLEAVPATVGALLATGGSFTLGVFYWMVFGIGYHLVGYGHNSWTDWKNGHDKNDPNKQHHPLNTGEMDPKWAGYCIMLGAAALLLYTIYGLSLNNEMWVMGIAAVGIAGAWMYNEKGKETRLKVVYIAVAHTTVFLIPYFGMGGDATPALIFGVLVMLFWVVYQILISGEIKDFQTDEVNFIRDHSVIQSTGERVPSEYVSMTGVILRGTLGAFALFVAGYLGADFTTFMAIIVLTILSGALSNLMIREQYNKRNKAVKTMSYIEMLSLFIFITAFSPIYSGTVGIIMMVLSVMWVIGLNKAMWSTMMKPEV